MDLKEIGREVVDWQWQALVNMVTNLRVPQKAENFLSNYQILMKDYAPRG
jgi:hypothetical protein